MKQLRAHEALGEGENANAGLQWARALVHFERDGHKIVQYEQDEKPVPRGSEPR